MPYNNTSKLTMKIFKSFLLLVWFFSFAQAQSILDEGDSQVIGDMISFNGELIQFQILGTCMQGNLVKGWKGSEVITSFEYVSKASLKKNSNRWVALSVNRLGDDVGSDFVNMTYLEDSGLVNKIKLDRIFGFNDFVVYNDSTIVVAANDSNKLLYYNFDGLVLQEIELPFPINSMLTDGEIIFCFSSNVISIIDIEGNLIDSQSVPDDIASTFYKSDILYVGAGSTFMTYNTDLDLIDSLEVTDDKVIQDICVNDSVYLLTAHSDYYGVQLLKDKNEIELYKNDNPNLLFESLILNGADLFLYGHQSVKDIEGQVFMNGVFLEIEEDVEDDYDVSIDLNGVEEILDTIMVHTLPDGTLAYEVSNSYNLNFEITNLSQETVNTILVSSNRVHGVNCAWAQVVKRYDNLNLRPNESVAIDTVFNAGRPFEDFCLLALSVEGNVDLDFSDNSTCKLISSTSKIASSEIKIYPNPVIDKLNIDSDIDLLKVQFYDILGSEIKNLSVDNAGSFDIQTLASGVNYIKVVTATGQSRIFTFIKE